MDTPELIAALRNSPGNFLNRLEILEQKIEELSVAETRPIDEIIHGVPRVFAVELSPAEGVLVTDPTDVGYTGVFISGNGILFSPDTYVLGSVQNGLIKAGFRDDGTLYAEDAIISGTITAADGAIGGWLITPTTIESLATDIGIVLDSSVPIIRVGNTASNHIVIDGANERIRSSNFVAGASGFNIDSATGDAEFNNLIARGMIRTAVFEKEVISSVGGSLLVLDSDVLDADMTAADSQNVTIQGTTTFAVGDILRMKDGLNDEWLEVTNIASAPTYVVTRDKAGAYSANANPAWRKGQAVVNYGTTGDGGIEITGGDTPSITVFTHAGSPWTTINQLILIDETEGITLLAGDETDPSYLRWTITNGDEVGHVTSFELADTSSSGTEVAGRQSTDADNSRVILNARDLSDSIKASFHVTSRGDATFDFRNGTLNAKGEQSLDIQTNTSETDELNAIFYLDTYTTGTPARGLGSAIAYRTEDTNGDMETLGYIGIHWEDPTHGTERSNIVVGNIVDSGVYQQSVLPAAGHAAYAMMDGASNGINWSADSANLAANGLALAVQINVNAPMRLRSVSVWNNDTASERKWNWGLFLQRTNSANVDENTLAQVAVGGTPETFTATVASLRTIAASNAPMYICPGVYWLVIQNQHASNTFALGRIAGTSLGGAGQTKVITNPFGSTIDFVAATWTKSASVFGVRLNGDVFGQSSAF